MNNPRPLDLLASLYVIRLVSYVVLVMSSLSSVFFFFLVLFPLFFIPWILPFWEPVLPSLEGEQVRRRHHRKTRISLK